MATSKVTLTLFAVGGLVCIGTAVLGVRADQSATAKLADSHREIAALQRRTAELEQRARGADQQVVLANQENARLLAEAETARSTSGSPAEEPINSTLVMQRIQLAQQLIAHGDPAEALRLLIWCYDVGMPRFPSMGSARTTLLLSFGRLGERYPPALDFLRQRREQTRDRYRADSGDTDVLSEYAMLNRALNDHAANLALLDGLPAGDRRRDRVLTAVYDHLIDIGRYKEAAEARSYSTISSLFEMMIQERPLPPGTADPERGRREQRESIVTLTAKNIEMLAGAGDLPHARQLAERLLNYDNSDATRATIVRHAARAGHPDLLAQPSSP